MSFPSYPEYKDSGVEWLGEVPSHWEVVATKRRFSVVGGSTPKSDVDGYWDGEILWVTPADLSQLQGFAIEDSARRITKEGLASCGTTMVPVGSLILSTRAPIGSLGLASRPLCTNQGCKSLIPSSEVSPLFYAYFYAVASEELNIRGKGTTFLELSADALAAFKIPAPPLPEQSAIAAFLDRETGKIDALVAEQEKLIELLKEKRQAVISHAVTKGLNPTVPMKDSGIKWLGMVPEHWRVAPLMHLTAPGRPIMYGIVLPGPNVDEGIPIVKGGDVKEHRLRAELLCRTTVDIEAPYARARLRKNDLLYSIRGTIGDVEVVPEELVGANITQDVARVSPSDNVEFQWLLYALRSEPVFTQLRQRSLGAAVPGVNIYDLKRAQIPVPPQHEQIEIAQALHQAASQANALIAEAQRAIDLLKEHRSALISAAVTGKIDVRMLAAECPNSVEKVPA